MRQTPGARALAKFKADHDLTHDQLAARVAASRSDLGDCKGRTVQDLIRGVRKPSGPMLAKLEALLETSASDWFPPSH